jgi:hypothetical protein
LFWCVRRRLFTVAAQEKGIGHGWVAGKVSTVTEEALMSQIEIIENPVAADMDDGSTKNMCSSALEAQTGTGVSDGLISVHAKVPQEDQLGIMDDGSGMILHGEIKQQHLAVNARIHLLLQLLQEDSFLLHLLNHGCHHHGRVVTPLTSQDHLLLHGIWCLRHLLPFEPGDPLHLKNLLQEFLIM